MSRDLKQKSHSMVLDWTKWGGVSRFSGRVSVSKKVGEVLSRGARAWMTSGQGSAVVARMTSRARSKTC